MPKVAQLPGSQTMHNPTVLQCLGGGGILETNNKVSPG